jgi:hypothetical protein
MGLAGGASPETIALNLPRLLRLEDAIDKALSTDSSAMPNGSPDLPVIQQEELDADLSKDIPF